MRTIKTLANWTLPLLLLLWCSSFLKNLSAWMLSSREMWSWSPVLLMEWTLDPTIHCRFKVHIKLNDSKKFANQNAGTFNQFGGYLNFTYFKTSRVYLQVCISSFNLFIVNKLPRQQEILSLKTPLLLLLSETWYPPKLCCSSQLLALSPPPMSLSRTSCLLPVTPWAFPARMLINFSSF